MAPKLFKKKLQKVQKKRSLGKTVKANFASDAPVQVQPETLKWKPVEIPDTMGDYEGFYGLEEIDGVDVKVVDGRAVFQIKDQDIHAKTLEKDEILAREKEIPKGDFEVDAEDIEELKKELEGEEAAFDGEEVPAVEESKTEHVKEKSTKKEKKTASKEEAPEIAPTVKEQPVITKLEKSRDTNDEKDIPELPKPENEPSKKKAKKAKKEEKLEETAFSAVSLPQEDAVLPEWNLPNVNLSSYTINALARNEMTTPTEIQKETLPLIFQGENVIGKAVTGSGKTLAYGIAIVENALNSKEAGPAGIIFTPTRELASQVTNHLKTLIEHSPIHNKTICSLTGGLSIEKQERNLSYDPKIIIATPGRFLELLEKSTTLAKQLAQTRFVVMDEADRLLLDGQFDELGKIMTILSNNRPNVNSGRHNWQTLIFSATFSQALFTKLESKKKPVGEAKGEIPHAELIKVLTDKVHFSKKPVVIDSNPNSVLSSKIIEAMIPSTGLDRDLMLYYFLTIYPGTTLVFTNSIDAVKRLAPTLNMLGIPTVSLHSNMMQKQRLNHFEKFQENVKKANGKATVMIASDVAARGLDIKGIQHVVHYHLPRAADTYVHRSGRTGRAGTEGVSVVLCDPKEASGPLKKLRSVVTEKKGGDKLGADLKLIEPDTNILNQLRERMRLAGKIAQAEVTNQNVNKEKAWMSEAMEDLGVEDLDDFEDDFLKKDRLKRSKKMIDKDTLKKMKKQLAFELRQPIRGTMRRSYITGGLDNVAHKLLNESKKRKNAEGVAAWLQKDALEELKGPKRRK